MTASILAEDRIALTPMADSPELARALDDANVPTLLAAYAYLTHDADFLERFTPHIRPAYSNPPTDIPEDLADRKSVV